MSIRRCRSVLFAPLIALLAAATPPRASATQKFGPLQLSGNLQSQNLVRDPDQSTYQFVQNRNTAHIRLDYDWLQAGRLYNRYDIPYVETSHLFVLWRGVYDSIYDTTPDVLVKTDNHGKAYGGRNLYEFATQVGTRFGRKTARPLELAGLSSGERDALKFDNQLREAYFDLKFRNIPLTVRAGRQQIVWGETDNFRMLDRANPLDLTWHFQQEIPTPAFSWDETRRPLWMIKFLYELSNVGPLTQSFLEWYWNPGDWYPAKQAFLPRPWGLRILNPLTNPIDGAFIGGVCDKSRVKRSAANGSLVGVCTTLLNNTRLFEQGDYARNPMDNSQVGVRYHGIAPFGLEFTLNYFYQRWSGDDGTNYAQLRGLSAATTPQKRVDSLEKAGIFPAEFIAPYVHTIGASANYSDEAYSQAVLRFETVYDFGIPFYDVAKSKKTVVDGLLPGVTKKNMWKGMIAFDRPTWIRPLNKKSTWFLTAQFFWHYLIDNPGCEAQNVANAPAGSALANTKSCLAGGLDLPSTQRLRNVAFRDKIRDWETLATFAAFSFYRGGSVVPALGIAVDTTNQFNMIPFWTVDYLVTSSVAVNLAQRYYVNPRGKDQLYESWGVAGLNTGRSETSLRLTYQF